MTKFVWISLLGCLAGQVGPVSGQDNTAPLTEDERKLFDELQVSAEAEQAARQRMEKAPAREPAPAELPPAAVKVLDRLAVYEASLSGIADEMVTQSRKKVAEQLIRIADGKTEPSKTELIAAAKKIEGFEVGVELPAPEEPEVDFPGDWKRGSSTYSYSKEGDVKTSWGSQGKWRWLHGSRRFIVADYAKGATVHLLQIDTKPGKVPAAVGVNDVGGRYEVTKGGVQPAKLWMPVEAAKPVSASRTYEVQVRTKSQKEMNEKRERVAVWLVDTAKKADPKAATLLLDNAGRLRAGAAGTAQLRNADAFRDKVFDDGKRRSWEFLPNGTVKTKGAVWGAWEWAKAEDDTRVVVYTTASGKTDSPMLVCLSKKTPDTLNFIGFDTKFDARAKK